MTPNRHWRSQGKPLPSPAEALDLPLAARPGSSSTRIVVWFRNSPLGVEVLQLIVMAATVVLVALVTASMWH